MQVSVGHGGMLQVYNKTIMTAVFTAGSRDRYGVMGGGNILGFLFESRWDCNRHHDAHTHRDQPINPYLPLSQPRFAR